MSTEGGFLNKDKSTAGQWMSVVGDGKVLKIGPFEPEPSPHASMAWHRLSQAQLYVGLASSYLFQEAPTNAKILKKADRLSRSWFKS
jgi:hypothetical protein